VSWQRRWRSTILISSTKQDRHLSGWQLHPVHLCLLVDGFDLQALGYIAPAVVQDFKILNAAV